MAGTKIGGQRAAATNKLKHGDDFYVKLGKIGGSKGAKDGVVKGFARNPALASKVGAIGGRRSKRTK